MSEQPADAVPPADPAAIPPPAEPVAGPALQAEADSLKDRLLRLQADFDNFRRRSLRERGEWSATATEGLLRELLPVLDHFDLGLKTAQERPTEAAVRDGFQMVYEQLLAVLKKAGLHPVEAQEASFDPHRHEAVAHVASDEHAEDEIVAQTRRGWRLGDRLLRPVQVVVSSGPGAPRDDEVKREPDAEGKGKES